MSILQRYIASSLVRGWMLVLLVLATVFGLIGFIQELERTHCDYDTLAVARYSVLILPQQLISLAPVIALLGTIVALANLDKFNELTIVSCAGISRRKMLLAVAIPTAMLMGLLWLSMEFVTAPLHQYAEQQRHALRFRHGVRIADGGVWSRHGRRYTHLGKMLDGGIPGDISLYKFNQQGDLLLALHAQTAEVYPDRRWLFKQVRKKELVDGELVTSGLPALAITNLWAPRELPTLTLSSDSMTLSVLYGYSQYLDRNGQAANRYLSTFWQKLALPLTVAAMVLLATPISASLGSRRERNFGTTMGIGALMGILFYLGAHIIFALGQLLNLHVVLVAMTPGGIILACALLMVRRMRW